MFKKITVVPAIVIVLVILFSSSAWCAYDMLLKITGIKSGSSLVSAEGKQSHRISILFYPAPGGANVNYPAFMVLATQICRAIPGALDVQADREKQTITILFIAPSAEEWINSLINELKAGLKEKRDINITAWEISDENRKK